MTEDRFEELLGSYLLGELTVEEERGLERHLQECPECRSELNRLRQTHDHLRKLTVSEPPPELKERVLAQVSGAPAARSGSGWFWGSVAAALLIVAILGVGLLQVLTGGSSTGVTLAATDLAPGAGGEARIEEVGQNLRVDLEVWGMPELEKGEYYEMWYYAEGDGRISCGTFRVGPEGRMTADLSAPVAAGDYPEIEVTREPDDGNPEASGEAVLEGRLKRT